MRTAALAVCLVVGLAGRNALWAGDDAPSSCVSCHKGAAKTESMAHNYADWEKSVHQKNGITCQSCHGGDPARADKAGAHAGVLPSSNQKSPVYFTKVPETCGACHASELDAFKKSAHYKELESSGRGPNCVTCHGSMANRVIEPKDMEMTCSLCHRKPTEAYSARSAVEQARVALRGLDAELQKVPAGTTNLPKRQTEYRALLDRFHTLLVSWHTFDTKKVLAEATSIRKDASTAFTELKRDSRKP